MIESQYNQASAPTEDIVTHGLLKPGHNCDCVRHARRFSVLVDAAAYFSVLRDAIRRARRTVFIVGWDINSRIRLVPGGAGDGLPEPLGEFLQAVAAANSQLRVYVLAWDFAMIYAFEREWPPVYASGWRSHRRIAFQQDGAHPPGASHHQKFVVVDDRLAFVGGIDLACSRWDTPAHAADASLRCDPNGLHYGPFHDVQAMFDADAARAIGQLARERWRRACGKALAIRAHRNMPPDDPWPPDVRVDLRNVALGIARTEPLYAGRPAVQQIRALYVDAIAAARHNIYIENQYLTAGAVRNALTERLADRDGPDVVAVVPRNHKGWLQEATMGVLRARLHRALVACDRNGRYRMLCPHVEGLACGCLNVHSKLMIVDDTLLCIGSANLNNRSMVLDTECNVAIDANGESRVREGIAAIRNRLVAEHLDVAASEVARSLARHASLNTAIDELRHDGRTLQTFDPTVSPELDALIPEHAWIDPEAPITADELLRQFAPERSVRSPVARWVAFGALALAMATLTALWQLTPLGRQIDLASLQHVGAQLGALPFAPAAVLAAYVGAALLAVPVTLLIAATGAVFGAWPGAAYASVGSVLAATASYYVGNWLGRDMVRKLAGARANRLSERIGRRGIVAVMLLRLVPIAPFTVVNLVAGASHIGIRDFLVGTALGMMPGILLTVTFAHQLIAAIRHPGGASLAWLVAIGLLLLALSVLTHRWLARRR